MDSAKGNGIENVTAKKTDWTNRSDNNMENIEIGLVNDEQERIIEELEEVLTFLKGVHIKNEESLVHMKKPLGDLQSSLKYLPTGPSINDLLPSEIKENIFSSLCDSNAFLAASVCREWKEVLESRFKDRNVTIGKNYCDCKDNDYIEPAEMVKAAATHKMDVHLVVKHPVTEVDSKLLADALTSVSKFTIDGNYYDEDDDSFDSAEKSTILSIGQLEDLMESLEKRDEIMENVDLLKLDLNNLNQERLSSCLANNVNKLMLDVGGYGGMMDAKTFVNQLQKGSTGMNLSHLTLHFFCDFSDSYDWSFDLADALCKVENVRLARNLISMKTNYCYYPQFDIDEDDSKMLKLLVKNVITCARPITMKTLIIERFIEYGPLISPVDLRNLFRKMPKLQLRGSFTKNQLEAIQSLPDLTVIKSLPDGISYQQQNESGVHILKGSNEIF